MKNLNAKYIDSDDNYLKALIGKLLEIHGDNFYKLKKDIISMLVIKNNVIVIAIMYNFVKHVKYIRPKKLYYSWYTYECKPIQMKPGMTNQQVIDYALTIKDMLYLIRIDDILDLCSIDIYTFICWYTAQLDEIAIDRLYISSVVPNKTYIEGGIVLNHLKCDDCMTRRHCNAGKIAPHAIITHAEIARMIYWNKNYNVHLMRPFMILLGEYIKKRALIPAPAPAPMPMPFNSEQLEQSAKDILEKLLQISPSKIQDANIRNGKTKEIFKHFDIDYPDFEKEHTKIFVVSVVKNNEGGLFLYRPVFSLDYHTWEKTRQRNPTLFIYNYTKDHPISDVFRRICWLLQIDPKTTENWLYYDKKCIIRNSKLTGPLPSEFDDWHCASGVGYIMDETDPDFGLITDDFNVDSYDVAALKRLIIRIVDKISGQLDRALPNELAFIVSADAFKRLLG